jgi:hypothetical protein
MKVMADPSAARFSAISDFEEKLVTMVLLGTA